jgi:release factor glutamine methyltransferase
MPHSPTLRSVLTEAIGRLSAVACPTPRLDAEVLLAHVLGQERSWLPGHWLDPIEPGQLDRFNRLLARREAREPVAYLVGYKAFYGLEFAVNSQVLIPRPETEHVVEQVIALAAGRPALTIVDVGTGSGCIAIALAYHLPQAGLVAVDRSAAALGLARRNAARHQVAGRITFVVADLLQPLSGRFDVIVSNPPYVSQAELVAAMPEVSRYEPELALLAGPDGLTVIRRLLAQAKRHLKPGGMLLVEIGSGHGPAVLKLAEQYFPAALRSILPDLAGLDRLLLVQP